jgi:hypothetical protein
VTIRSRLIFLVVLPFTDEIRWSCHVVRNPADELLPANDHVGDWIAPTLHAVEHDTHEESSPDAMAGS